MPSNEELSKRVVERIQAFTSTFDDGRFEDSPPPNAIWNTLSLNLGQTLQNTGALLAGGFVLRAIHQDTDLEGGEGLIWSDIRAGDMDLYVTRSKASELLNTLAAYGIMPASGWGRVLETITTDLVLAPAYDQSFFRKNGILMRIPLFVGENSSHRIDLMVLVDGKEPIEVVTNFDLTFCEVWWDGNMVHGTDLEAAYHKRGVLRKGYRDALLVHFNKFIIKRIKKYLDRGYTIEYESGEVDTECISTPIVIGHEEIEFKVSKRVVRSEEDWVISYMYQALIKTRVSPFYTGLVKIPYKNMVILRAFAQIRWILQNPPPQTLQELNDLLSRVAKEESDLPKSIFYSLVIILDNRFEYLSDYYKSMFNDKLEIAPGENLTLCLDTPENIRKLVNFLPRTCLGQPYYLKRIKDGATWPTGVATWGLPEERWGGARRRALWPPALVTKTDRTRPRLSLYYLRDYRRSNWMQPALLSGRGHIFESLMEEYHKVSQYWAYPVMSSELAEHYPGVATCAVTATLMLLTSQWNDGHTKCLRKKDTDSRNPGLWQLGLFGEGSLLEGVSELVIPKCVPIPNALAGTASIILARDNNFIVWRVRRANGNPSLLVERGYNDFSGFLGELLENLDEQRLTIPIGNLKLDGIYAIENLLPQEVGADWLQSSSNPLLGIQSLHLDPSQLQVLSYFAEAEVKIKCIFVTRLEVETYRDRWPPKKTGKIEILLGAPTSDWSESDDKHLETIMSEKVIDARDEPPQPAAADSDEVDWDNDPD